MTKTEHTDPQFVARAFDGNPSISGDVGWPDFWDIDAESPESALEVALTRAVNSVRGVEDYPEGTEIWVIVWDYSDTIVAEGSVTV